MGTVIELPEREMGMGSELVSCMPGFLAAIFQEMCASAKKHTSLSEDEIARMVLHTVVGTGTLMIEKEYSFHDVVERVATKGGITEERTKVIEAQFPKVADDLFDKTLEKRRQTTEKAQRSFEEAGE
jgi:pyrroline-5-carboxylate reductase